jgi:recombination protein RecT
MPKQHKANSLTAPARQLALRNLKQTLASSKAVWYDAVPKTLAAILTQERITKVVLLAATAKSSKLLECTTKSLIRSIADAVTLGLEPGGPLGHAYLVPFRDSATGTYVAQLIIGYRGYIALARRSGEITSVEAYCYHANDTFRIRLGTESIIEHEPCMDGERGALRGVYCVAKFRDGGHHMDFMTKADVEKIRAFSKAGNSGPWVTNYDEMARKSVVRRASKYWPLSADLAEALAYDEEEQQSAEDVANVIDMSFEEADSPEPTEAQSIDEPADKEPESNAGDDSGSSIADYQDRIKKFIS